MKKALLLILSIVTILSAVCMPAMAEEYVGHEVVGGETVTVLFKQHQVLHQARPHTARKVKAYDNVGRPDCIQSDRCVIRIASTCAVGWACCVRGCTPTKEVITASSGNNRRQGQGDIIRFGLAGRRT